MGGRCTYLAKLTLAKSKVLCGLIKGFTLDVLYYFGLELVRLVAVARVKANQLGIIVKHHIYTSKSAMP